MISAETVENIFEAVEPKRRRLRASLDLEFRQDAGRTVLAKNAQEPPLRVVRRFAQQDGSALVHLHNVSGGLLGGDELSLRVILGKNTNVVLTTTGATRVYRPRADALPAQHINAISVGPGALLEYVPDQIIPFAGARFSQRTAIRLADDSGLFWWEVLAPGREAHGELFAYECVEMKTDLIALARPITCEQVRLAPSRDWLLGTRMGDYRYWASLYICRVGVDSKVWLTVEDEVRQVAAKLGDSAKMRWGISTLVAHGLVIRCLAQRGYQVFAGLRAIWSAAKSLLYGREAILPRKVS